MRRIERMKDLPLLHLSIVSRSHRAASAGSPASSIDRLQQRSCQIRQQQ